MYLKSFNQNPYEELGHLQHSLSFLLLSDISKTCHITLNKSAR